MIKMNPVHKLFCFTLGFTLLLVIARMFYTGGHAFIFLFWNLFLAWIPLFLTYHFRHGKGYLVRNIILLTGWLLFFPNALYLVTDLVHLGDRDDAPQWFDIILLFSGVMNGLMLGYASIIKVDIFLRNYFTVRKVNFLLLVSLFIGSFGVYLGRFLRWNSWDVVTKPGSLFSELFTQVASPLMHPRAWAMTCTLSLFFALFYFTLRKLPGLLAEKNT